MPAITMKGVRVTSAEAVRRIYKLRVAKGKRIEKEFGESYAAQLLNGQIKAAEEELEAAKATKNFDKNLAARTKILNLKSRYIDKLDAFLKKEWKKPDNGKWFFIWLSITPAPISL